MGEWHYLVRPMRNGARGWMAMAKKSPFIGDSPVNDPDELWFEIADTEEKARSAIEAEVRRMCN